jgi:NlpC/P60 family/Bacterial SH3 domain
LRTPHIGARAFVVPVALAAAVLLSQAPASPVSAAAPKTEAGQIIKIAKKQIGDPWRYGANGPRSFDCSGLVIYAFRKAGDAKAVGNGKYRSARALYKWYKARGLASRSNPKVGDLVVWGGGTHIGIYIGKGKAISTLTSGVKIHRVHAVTARFTAYLHTKMSTKSVTGGSVKAKTAVAHKLSAATRHTRVALNLRIAAGIGNARIAVLPRGTAVTVTGKASDGAGRTWLHVRTGSRTGWVAGWLTR